MGRWATGLVRQRDDTGRCLTARTLGQVVPAGVGSPTITRWFRRRAAQLPRREATTRDSGRPAGTLFCKKMGAWCQCRGAVSGRVCFACVVIRCRGSSLLYFLQTRFTPVRGRRIPQTQIGARLIIHSAAGYKNLCSLSLSSFV